MIDPMIFDQMRKSMNEYRQDVEAFILSGNCRDHTEYKYRIGLRDGVARAMEIVEEVERRYVEE